MWESSLQMDVDLIGFVPINSGHVVVCCRSGDSSPNEP